MFIRLRTHTESDQFMFRRSCFGFASINQIRSWTANGVFDYIRQKGRSNQRNDKAQKADVEFVCGRACDKRPQEEDERGKDGGVDN